MDVEKVLKDIGLKNNEIKVYLTLLSLKEAKASKVANLTKVNRSLVYEILDSLRNKGLVSLINKENKTHFIAGDPENLLRILEEKKENLNLVLGEINKIRPPKSTDLIVEVYSGLEGLKKVLREQLEGYPVIYVLGAGNEFKGFTKHFYDQYYLKRIKKKIFQKVLFKKDAKDLAIKVLNSPYSEARILPKEYQFPTAIVIYGDNSAIFSWNDQKVVVMRSKNLSKGFLEQFSILWRVSKKI